MVYHTPSKIDRAEIGPLRNRGRQPMLITVVMFAVLLVVLALRDRIAEGRERSVTIQGF